MHLIFTFAPMKNVIIALTIAFLSACSIFKGGSPITETWHVNNTNENCKTTGADFCLEYRNVEDEDSTWKYLSNPIEGFLYEKGFNYKLKINKTKLSKKDRPNPYEKYKYSLVEVLEKTLVIDKPGLYVKIETSMGDIYGELAYELAPLTVANFVGLTEGVIPNTAKDLGVPFYDGLIFHRVIPSFMIQGGDPTGTGTSGPGYKFKNENSPSLRHDKPGIFSMANSGPNTNGSQFFITHKATPWLDGGYNVFGEVIHGQDVVNAIGNVPRDGRDKPKTPVIMKKASIIRVGDGAKSFNALKTFNLLKQ